MGIWDVLFENKQKQFDSLTLRVFNEITHLADLLDKNNGAMNYNDRRKVEDAVVDFIRFYRANKFSLRYVNWCGERETMQFVTKAIYGFINEVENATGHRFTRLNEPR